MPQPSQFILAWDMQRNMLDCIPPWLATESVVTENTLRTLLFYTHWYNCSMCRNWNTAVTLPQTTLRFCKAKSTDDASWPHAVQLGHHKPTHGQSARRTPYTPLPAAGNSAARWKLQALWFLTVPANKTKNSRVNSGSQSHPSLEVKSLTGSEQKL